MAGWVHVTEYKIPQPKTKKRKKKRREREREREREKKKKKKKRMCNLFNGKSVCFLRKKEKKAVDLNKTVSMFNNSAIGEREKQNKKTTTESYILFPLYAPNGTWCKKQQQMFCYFVIVYRQDICLPPTALLCHCSIQCGPVS